MAKKKRAAEELRAIPPDLDEDRKLTKLKADHAALKAKHKEALKQLGDMEKQVDSLTALPAVKHRKARRPKRGKPQGEAAAVLVVTDWHSDQLVDPEMVEGRNEFNSDIFVARTDVLWDKALRMLDYARGLCEIDTFYVAALGDLIGGYIHEELQESNTMGPEEAIVLVRDRLTFGIDKLRKHCGCQSFNVLCCYGNHGRTTKRIRHGTGYKTNREWGLYSSMAKHYANHDPDMRWNVAKGYLLTEDIKGNLVRFQHGHNVRYQGGVGGVTIPANKAQAAWNRNLKTPPQWDIIGHWHQFLRQEGMILCPSLIGYDAFALSIKAQYQDPAQAMVVFDREKGVVMAEKVFVTE